MSSRSTCHCGEPLGIDGICPRCLAAVARDVIAETETARAADSQTAQTIDQLLRGRGAAVIVARPPQPPADDQLGRYPVTGQLGAGGMGQILQVWDENLGREMAAKVIKGRTDPLVLDKFIREAQITGQLEHPNIVPTHELGLTPDQRIYFTMKRVQGEDLATMLDDERETVGAMLQDKDGPRPSSRRLVADIATVRRRSLSEMLQIFLKVCDAVCFAHSKGVIHRDLKPANIMVGQFGEVQVMDWGLASQLGQPDPVAAACTLDLGGGPLAELARRGAAGQPLTTLDGTVVGTPHYMPPEQARGEISALDRRADVYALGAILYQMLTLELPFEGSSAWDVLLQVAQGQLIAPTERTPGREIPRDLEAVVLKAMAARPSQRYDTVERLKRDIEAYLEGRLLQAAEYSTWQVVTKWAARHKPAVIAAAVILLTLLVTLGGTSWQWRRAEAELSKRVAAEEVRKAMEIYDRKGDLDKVNQYLTQAEQALPDHHGLLRLRGRIALDQKKWSQARGLLDRALTRQPRDYLTHFLLYRWYAEQGRGNTAEAQTHVKAAAEYGTRDSAIGLWGLAKRAYMDSARLARSEMRKKLELGVELSTEALAKQEAFAWALIIRGLCHKDLENWEASQADHDRVITLTGWPNAYLNRGNLRHAMKRYDKALEDYDKALRLDPQSFSAYNSRGDLHLDAERYDEARADFDKAINLNPKFSRAYNNRGVLHYEIRRYDEALADYAQAIRLDPESARAHMNRGKLHDEMKQYHKARSDFDKAINLNPKLAVAYDARGLLHYAMKRYDKARADFDKAINLNPKFSRAYNNRGVLHYEIRRYDEALADYAQAIRLDPQLPKAHMNRGQAHHAMKRYDKALADYDNAIRLDPQLTMAHLYRGKWHQKMKRYDKALTDYDNAIRLDPLLDKTYFHRAGLHEEMKRPHKALADFDSAIRINPRWPLAYRNRGRLRRLMTQYDGAQSDFDKALSIDPSHHETYYERGLLQRLLKKHEKALEDFNQAIRLNPRSAWAYWERGKLHNKTGHPAKALADYSAVIHIDPRFVEAFVNRGNLHRELNHYDKALADYDKAILIAPRFALAYINRGILHEMMKRHDKALADYQRALPLVRGTALEKKLAGFILEAKSRLK